MGGDGRYMVGRDVRVYMYLAGPRNLHPYRGIGWAIRETALCQCARCILSLECNYYILITRICSLSTASMVVLPLCSVSVSSAKFF